MILFFSFPEDFLLLIGNIETYLTHTINVRKCISPIVFLLYGCVPVKITIGLIILDTVIRGPGISHILSVGFVKVPTDITVCHQMISSSSGRNALRSNRSSFVVIPITELISGNIERTHHVRPSSSLTLSETERRFPSLSVNVLIMLTNLRLRLCSNPHSNVRPFAKCLG